MYHIATYAGANIKKTANSQVRLDARLDYNLYYYYPATIAHSVVSLISLHMWKLGFV